MLLRLAIRNLLRHRRRTVITSIAIAVSIACYIFLQSLLAGFEDESYKNMVSQETGQVLVSAQGYWADREKAPLDKALTKADEITAALRKGSDVKAVTPRVTFTANINNGVEESPVLAIGVDPKTINTVLDLKPAVVKGRFLRAGESEAMIGASLAKLMDLRLGDQFTLVFRTKESSFEALDLTVGAILESSDPLMNGEAVYLPLDVAQRTAKLPGGATDILVAGKGNYKNVEPLAAQVKALLSSGGVRAEVHTWKDAAKDMIEMMKVEKATDSMLLLFVVIVAAIGIINSIVLASIERTREIGTLKAMGMNEKDIILLFMLEGTGIGAVGGLLGLALGGSLMYYLATVGFDMSVYKDMDIGFSVTGVVHATWSWTVLAGALITGIIASFMISYLPARRAARMDPIAALRS